MSWQSIVENSSRALLNTFGENVVVIMSDGSEKNIKGIFSVHSKKMYNNYLDMESSEKIISIASKDVQNPDDCVGVIHNGIRYYISKKKLETDGFNLYFLTTSSGIGDSYV